MKFKQYLLQEKVSPDCSTGPGVIPSGPYKGWEVIRTNHLDDERATGRERDHGFDCDAFDKLIDTLLRKRPLGLKDGKLQLTWKNNKGFQAAVIDIDNEKKNITFITIMQMNRKKSTQYETKGASSINLGLVPEPE